MFSFVSIEQNVFINIFYKIRLNLGVIHHYKLAKQSRALSFSEKKIGKVHIRNKNRFLTLLLKMLLCISKYHSLMITKSVCA